MKLIRPDREASVRTVFGDYGCFKIRFESWDNHFLFSYSHA